MAFKKATKAQLKLRLALSGPAGSGKTYTALTLATALADGRPVAVIDTERGSASKYADLFAFDVLELESFHPQKYVEAINEAVAAGYAVIVIDSLSHAWSGKGGILEIVQRKGNSFQAWGEVKPIEAALIEAVTGARIHVIATMRSKTEYVVEKDERTGKSAPRKVGMAPVQRDGMEYEFDVFGELDQENTLTIQKTRCPALAGALISKPGKSLAATLGAWLSGASTTPATAEPAARRWPEPTQEDLDEEDGYLAEMAGISDKDNADDADEDEAITYAAEEDEDEPAPTPLHAPAPPATPATSDWHPLEDVKFITSLRDIQIVKVADQESFISAALMNYPTETTREACRKEYARRFNEQKNELKTATTKAKASTRGRGPSALGATSGEPVPESLESLPVGQKGA